MARNRRLCFIATVLATVFLMAAVASVGYGQTVSGAIGGTVADASGAFVPGAKVTVTRTSTGVQSETVTNQAGDYRVPFLIVGTYSVRVEAPGFKVFLRDGLILRVNEVLHIDATLQVGSVQEQVTVTGAAPLLNTENASTGNVIENERVVTLPLNGRNFLQMTQLTADVNRGSWGNMNALQQVNTAQKGVSLSADGQRDAQALFLVDGANVRGGFWGSITMIPSIDAIQEFEMQTASFSAQNGTSPLSVNVVTKSGTNILHGSLFEFTRQAFLNAQNFFATPATSNLPWHQHNFGGSVGGPVFLPHIYNGKDKTFFFFNYEGERIISKAPYPLAVPTQAYRQGDFSAALPGKVIKDPATGIPFGQSLVGGVLTGSPTNVVPTSRIQGYTKLTNPLWPPAPSTLTAGGVGAQTITVAAPQLMGDNEAVARIDHRISSHDQLYGRWADTNPYYTGTTPGVSQNPTFLDVNSQDGQNLLVGETHGFGPQMFNEFRFAYNHSVQQNGPPPSRAVDLASQLQWGGVTQTIGLPIVNVSGYGILTDMPPGGYNQQTFQFSDNLSAHRGKHTIITGLDIFRFTSTIEVPGGFHSPFPRATASFLGAYSGDNFADYLMGYPYQGGNTVSRAGYASPAMDFSYPDFNFYVQDDWKFSRRFTFNIGLRYELVPVLTNPAMRDFNFQTGQLSTQGATQAFYQGAHKDFAPRVGFAWQPFEGGKTVVRAGYGIYYARSISQGPATLSKNPPATLKYTFVNGAVTPANASFVTMSTFVSNTSAGSFVGASLSAVDPYYTPTPFTQIRSFDIQHQFPAGFLVDVGYKGSLTNHLDGYVDQNTALPGPGAVQPRRPYPSWGSTMDVMAVFNSNYNAAIVRVEKRMGKGLSLLSSYSWSKCMDQVGTPNGQGQEEGGTQGAEDRTNLAREKGLCATQYLHRAVFSYIYEFPFGRGKPFLNSGGVLDKFVGGWTLTGITAFQSGAPESVQDSIDVSNTGAAYQRPDVYCNPNLSSSQRTLQHWFNTSCFGNVGLDNPADPSSYRFGNSGRMVILNAPGINNFDMALLKDTSVKERVRLQFRAEFFNAFNHPPLGTPDSAMSDSHYGWITTAGNPRQIQLALKLLW